MKLLHVDNVFVLHSAIKGNPMNVVEGFKNAENGILIGAAMLSEGIDIPSADIGINVAFTKSELQLIQRMGRVLRKDKDKKPTFYQFVAIPDREAYLDIMDAQEFMDDLAWVEATGLRMGLDLDIVWDTEELKKYRSEIEEFWRSSCSDEKIPEKIGSFSLKSALEEFSKTAVKRIPDILSVYSSDTITDAQWDDIIRFAHSTVNEKGELADGEKKRHVNLTKAWYILVLCGRSVEKLKELFENASINITLEDEHPLPNLTLDSNGMLILVEKEVKKNDTTDITEESESEKIVPADDTISENAPRLNDNNIEGEKVTVNIVEETEEVQPAILTNAVIEGEPEITLSPSPVIETKQEAVILCGTVTKATNVVERIHEVNENEIQSARSFGDIVAAASASFSSKTEQDVPKDSVTATSASFILKSDGDRFGDIVAAASASFLSKSEHIVHEDTVTASSSPIRVEPEGDVFEDLSVAPIIHHQPENLKTSSVSLTKNILKSRGILIPQKYLDIFGNDDFVRVGHCKRSILSNGILYSGELETLKNGDVVFKWERKLNRSLKKSWKASHKNTSIEFERNSTNNELILILNM